MGRATPPGWWGRPRRCERQGRIGVRKESAAEQAMGGGARRRRGCRRARRPSCCSPCPPAAPTAATRCARSSTTPRNVIPGEEVKIDGVKVGTVGSVTADAAGEGRGRPEHRKPRLPGLSLGRQLHDPPAGADRREVRRLPADPAARGRHAAAAAAARRSRAAGRRRASTCCRSATRSSPVDVDLLGDISRLPERQRLTIIINEFGAGLAGRGSDLNDVIRRANPALQELDKVLAILAEREPGARRNWRSTPTRRSRPLARVREQVAELHRPEQHGRAGERSAPRRARSRTSQTFPPFLRQLGAGDGTARRFAEQTTPAFTDLGIAAPGHQQGVHATAGLLQQLERLLHRASARTARPRGRRSSRRKPLLEELEIARRRRRSRSPATSRPLLDEPEGTGGLERMLDFIFLGAGAANGYDALGHFLRTEGVGNARA